jgi:hypothetical protein
MHRLWQALSIVGLICLVVFLIRNWPEDHSARYDCGILIGGWHPDVPPAVREKCMSGRQDDRS